MQLDFEFGLSLISSFGLIWRLKISFSLSRTPNNLTPPLGTVWGWTELGNIVKICRDILDKTIVRNNYMLGASFTDLQMILPWHLIHTHTPRYRVTRITSLFYWYRLWPIPNQLLIKFGTNFTMLTQLPKLPTFPN